MEYRRRRRKGRRTTQGGRRREQSAGAGGALITLLLAAGLIYILVSGAVGDWVAERVITPVSALFKGDADEGGDEYGGDVQSVTTGETDIDLSAGDAAPVSAQLTFPGVSCHMLQMGVFSSRENADAEAAALRARGAAGYILEDASSGEVRYRVMASGYEDEQSAKSVRDRLVSEGTDCTVYELASVSSVFRVTAPEGSMAGVETGFAALSLARESMAEAVIRFDKESLTVSEGRALTEDIQDTLALDMARLNAFAPDGGALSEIFDAYSAINASISTLCEGEYESVVDFSAAMKYTYLNITQLYAALTDALAG